MLKLQTAGLRLGREVPPSAHSPRTVRLFEFSSVKAGGMYSVDGRAHKTSGGQSQLTMNRTLDLSDESQASGNIRWGLRLDQRRISQRW